MQAAVDLSGRPYFVHHEPDGAPPTIGAGYATTLTRHVFESFTYHAAIALHVNVQSGRDWHHIVEAQYKAVARSLRTRSNSTRGCRACRRPRACCDVPHRRDFALSSCGASQRCAASEERS